MINYYRLLNIPQTAGAAEIEKAIKTERRTWNQRANNPKAEIRAEAEQRIRDIAEAEKILLNAQSRANYDREVANAPEKQTAMPTGETEDWVKVAVDFYKKSDYESMAYAAREATQIMPKESIAWFWRGVASSRLNRDSDAKFELQRAIELNPDDVDYYSELADVYKELKDYKNAYQLYTKASNMDSENLYYLASASECLILNKQFNEAVELAKKVYTKDPSYKYGQAAYLLALYKQIFAAISYDASDDTYYVTNQTQLAFFKTKLDIVNSVRADSDDAREIKADLNDLYARSEKVRYIGSSRILWYLCAAGFGLFSLSSGRGSNVGLGLLCLVATVAVFYFRHFKPNWKWNKGAVSREVCRTGLQDN